MKYFTCLFACLCLFFLVNPVVLLAAGPEWLGTILDFLKTAPLDHPIISIAIVFAMQKGGPIIWFLIWVLKALRDGLMNDTEAAGTLWRLAAIINGFWPNKSQKIILKHAPRHWHPVILEGKDPTFQLIPVPLKQVNAVLSFLESKPPEGG